MGQKVNPIGLRVGINRTWDSRWFADKDYAQLLHEDLRIKKFLTERLTQAGGARVGINLFGILISMCLSFIFLSFSHSSLSSLPSQYLAIAVLFFLSFSLVISRCLFLYLSLLFFFLFVSRFSLFIFSSLLEQ